MQTVTKNEVGKEIRDFQYIIESSVPDKSPKPAKKLGLEAVSHVRTMRERKDAQQVMGNKFRGFFCDHCGIPAEREGLKEWHSGSVHGNTMEVVCQHCADELLYKVKLQLHMK